MSTISCNEVQYFRPIILQRGFFSKQADMAAVGDSDFEDLIFWRGDSLRHVEGLRRQGDVVVFAYYEGEGAFHVLNVDLLSEDLHLAFPQGVLFEDAPARPVNTKPRPSLEGCHTMCERS